MILCDMFCKAINGGEKIHFKNNFNFGFHCTVYIFCMEKEAKINIEHLKKMFTRTVSVQCRCNSVGGGGGGKAERLPKYYIA